MREGCVEPKTIKGKKALDQSKINLIENEYHCKCILVKYGKILERSWSEIRTSMNQKCLDKLKQYRSSTDEKEHVKPNRERKFLVFEKHLLSLFATCPICAGPAEARLTKVISTMVKINQCSAEEKSCQFSRITSCLRCCQGSTNLKINTLQSNDISTGPYNVVKASRVVRLKECPNAKAPCVPQVIEEAMKGVAQNWKQDSD
ncbi:hypothetical protein P5673_031270, partial [Acropora cervicornis]